VVKASSVVFDKETGKARGFGFVEFVNAEDATKALGQHDIGGRTATIRHAKRSARYRAPGSPASSAPPSAPASAASPKLKVFTTRPDTLFGATYMVVSPEHPLLDQLVSPENKAAVDAYVTSASTKSDLERTGTNIH
jgi:RNA recognition motif-containing protein